MKKTIIFAAMAAVVVLALGTAGLVYAQSPAAAGAAQYGRGMMGGRAQGGMMANGGVESGVLHDAMTAGFAQELGISVDDLNARLANGETMYQIATANGLTSDAFYALMSNVRTQAVAQAVANGELTQEQADWMSQRSAGMGGTTGGMRGGMRGAAQGTGPGTYENCPAAGTTVAP